MKFNFFGKNHFKTFSFNVIVKSSFYRLFNYTIFSLPKFILRTVGVLALFLFLGESLKGQVTITLTGTGNWTVPSGVTSITVKCYGGGGSGGGSSASGKGGGGGGGGAYCEKTISVSSGNVFTYSAGTAGAQSTATSAGNQGQASTFVNSALTVNMNAGGGGAGGLGSSSGLGTAGSGGTASGGTINTSGNSGAAGTSTTGGSGGSCPNGGAGGAQVTSGTGNNGASPGGAGSGGFYSVSTSRKGGKAGDGYITITYTQTNATLPYNEDFSGGMWYTSNGTQTNRWFWGSSFGNPSAAMYISNDNGVSNAYSNSTSIVHAYRDVTIPANSTLASLSFNWKANGESGYDYLRVWLVPTSYSPVSGTSITSGSGGIQVGGDFNLQTTWQTFSNAALDISSFANATMRIIFEWTNDGSGGTTPPAAIDNISLSLVPACSAPTSLAVTASSTAQSNSTISASFTAANSAPTAYLVVRTDLNTQPVPVTGTTYTTGLNAIGFIEYVGSSAGSWTSTSLTSGTTYYYWVFSYNNTNCTGGPVYSASATTFSQATSSCTGAALANLSYSTATASYCLSSAITNNTATLGTSSGVPTYSISPALPAGLSLSTSTGTISGTPSAAVASTNYTVTADNGCTNTTATLTISTISLPVTPTSSAATSAVTYGFTANWSASSGATAYLLDVSTSSTFTSMVSGYDGLNVGNVTTYGVTGLVSGTTYYYRVRSTNGTCNSLNSSSQTTATTALTSIASGNWNSGSTWSGGQVPTCNDNVTILTGNTVTVNSSSNVSKNTTINSGGTLTIASGDLTVGCTLNNTPLTNNGTLTVTGGTLNVNGNISSALGSSFNQSGGAINIDGNNGGSTTGSVASGIPLISLNQANTGINLTGGVLTIVDPHTASTNTSAYAFYYSYGTAGTQTSNSNHLTRFGNGVSADAGGNTSGFYINQWASTAMLAFGSVEINGPSANNRSFVLGYTSVIRGNLTINSNARLDVTSNIRLQGNLVVNAGGVFASTALLSLQEVIANTSNTSTAAPVSVAQSISGSGTFQNASTNSTASLTNLTINNSSASGVTISTPLSVSGTLTMTAGKINTSATNLLTLGTATAAGTLSYTAGQIAGPFARTFAASTTGTTSTFGVGTLFPVGDGTTYMPLYINPVTSAGGPVVFTGQVFNSNSGTGGAGLSSTLGSRRWEALISSGAANLTSCFIQLNDASIASGNQIVQSGSPAGTYNTIIPNSTFTSGTPNTLQTATAINIANYAGYFSYAAPGPVITSFTPTSVCPGTSSTITITGTNLGSPSSVTLNGEACTVTNSSPTSITITTDATPQAGSIVVTTAANSATSATALSLYTLPTVTASSNASNNTICSGTSVTLNGGGASTYTWNNGVSNNVSFTPISTNSYTVTGTDGNGCVNTASITITVNNAVSISAQPISQVVLPSANATFSVTASGTGLTYQWEENTGSSWSAITNGGIYSGATTNTLTLTAVTSSESGYQYRCVVSGTTPCAAATSSAATLTISTTAISAQPQNQSICLSSGTASFSVSTTGSTPTYQWQLSTNSGSTWSDITGETSVSLSLSNLTLTESGNLYRCVLNGNLTSNSATLTVSPVSVAGTVSSNQAICSGSTPSSITLSGNTGSIQWQVSSDNSTFNDISGATSSTLGASTIGALTSTRYYRAVVTSGGCTAANSSAVTVTVTPTPNAGTLSGTQTVCANSTTTFSSNGDTGGTWSSATTATATVNSSTGVITGVAAGTTTITYTITGTGGCSNATATRTVTVNAVPSITSATASPSTLCAGSTVSLSAASIAISAGNLTLGTGTTTTSSTGITPYSSNWEGARIQYLVTASELSTLGLVAGNITSLSFIVTTAGSYTMQGYTIKMGHTTATSLSSAYATISGSFTTVFGPLAKTTPAVGNDLMAFSTPFNWDGTSNIIVEICHDNDPTATCSYCYGTNSTVQYTATSFNSVYGRYGDNTPLCGQANGSAITPSTNRPNIIFAGQVGTNNAANYTWSWDSTPTVSTATGTTTAVNNTSTATTQTYTVTATIASSGCSSTATTSAVTINPTPATPTANNTTICGPQNATCSVTGTGISGNTFKWYTVPTGGTMITGQTGSSLSAYPISTTTNLYASEANANCESARVQVIQTVTSPPSITASASSSTVCAGSNTTLSASSSNSGYTYTWNNSAGSGSSVTVSPTSTTTYTVTGTDASGGVNNGCATTATTSVTVNALPSGVSVSSSTICNGGVATIAYTPSSTIIGQVGNGSTNSTSSTTPYRQGINTTAANNSQSRIQYLVTQAELNAAGIVGPTMLTSLGFNVVTVGSGAMPNFTISLAQSSLTALNSTYVSTGFTTVYSVTNLSPIAGVNTHSFQTYFSWDGTSNIIVNICHTGTNGTASVVSVSTLTNVSTASGAASGQCSVATAAATDVKRPNIYFGTNNSSTITWTPTTPSNTLYTDANASTAYTAGASATTVYALPTATTTYTATATSSAGCTASSTATITVNQPSVAPTSITGTNSICIGASTTLTANGGTLGTGANYQWGTGSTVGTNPIAGQTSASITVSPTSTTTYWVRIVNGSSPCTATTSGVSQAVTVDPLNTWIGGNGNWSDPNNWCGGLPTSSTAVVVSNNATVTLNAGAGVTTQVSSLTINSGATLVVATGEQLTLTGALVNNGTMIIESGGTFKQGTSVSGNGVYNVQQYVSGSNSNGSLDGRYWYMGVPLSVTRESGFGASGTTNGLWAWSETGQTYSLVGNSASLSPTSGYVYRRGDNQTLVFSGSGSAGTGLYAQDASLTGLTKTGAFYSGYHLKANPFTAYLDFDQMYAASTNMSSTVWTRSANGTTMVFDTYNASSQSGVSNSSPTTSTTNMKYIAPMQAFWVRVAGNTGTTGSINMTRAMTSHNSTYGGLKSSLDFPAFARVNLIDGSKYDQILVYLRQDQSNVVDNYDSEKMFATGMVQLYSMSAGKKLVMNGLKNDKKKISVPLYLDLPSTQAYELNLSEFNMENGVILLEDKQEGILQDFTTHDHYTFYASAGSLNNRFVLHFYMPDNTIAAQGPSNSWVDENQSTGGIFIGSDGKGMVLIQLEAVNETTTNDHVKVFSATGQLVYDNELILSTTEFLLDVETGFYLVEVYNGSNHTVKKIFVQH